MNAIMPMHNITIPILVFLVSIFETINKRPITIKTNPMPMLRKIISGEISSIKRSIVPSIRFSIYSTSINLTLLIKKETERLAIIPMKIENTSKLWELVAEFATTLHITDDKITAVKIVVGMDFFINPSPDEIAPIDAAIMDTMIVIFMASKNTVWVKGLMFILKSL